MNVIVQALWSVDRTLGGLGYWLRVLPHMPRLLWHRLWIRKNEFHPSLDLDVRLMQALNVRDQNRYMADLGKRRQRAHARGLDGPQLGRHFPPQPGNP